MNILRIGVIHGVRADGVPVVQFPSGHVRPLFHLCTYAEEGGGSTVTIQIAQKRPGNVQHGAVVIGQGDDGAGAVVGLPFGFGDHKFPVVPVQQRNLHQLPFAVHRVLQGKGQQKTPGAGKERQVGQRSRIGQLADRRTIMRCIRIVEGKAFLDRPADHLPDHAPLGKNVPQA